MATPDDITKLRLLVAEPDDTTYTDAVLVTRLDAAFGNENVVAYEIWTEKAAAAAQLVDVSEGGSSRKMGDIYEQALAMAKTFAERAQSPVTPPDGSGTGVRVRQITRP